jgi:glycosyltransferase involved in cell wall biosynthesis
MTRVSCVIPAYNEETRIGNVLEAVVNHPLIDEIIVVDDGSRDGTRAEAQGFPSVRLLTSEKNIGKSGSIAKGVRVSTGEYLVFLDADLVGLAPKDVTALLRPVLSGAADFSISLRHDVLVPWRMIGLDYLSGERALHRGLVVEHLDTIAQLPGFGFESYLNSLVIESGARVQVVRWPTVGHTFKVHKYGIWEGVRGEMRMLKNIAEIVSPIGTGYQVIAMWRAQVS